MWQAVVERYHGLSFRDLVHFAHAGCMESANPSDFGGLGMNSEESAIFYAIGIGDGSWEHFMMFAASNTVRQSFSNSFG